MAGEEVSPSETWIINETPTFPEETAYYYIDFISNGIQYKTFHLILEGQIGKIVYNTSQLSIYYIGTYVYDNSQGSYPNTWVAGINYRTVTFSTTPSDDLLTWLNSNATKQ